MAEGLPQMGMGRAKKPNPTDEDLVSMETEVDQIKADTMGQGAPEPTRPYRARTMTELRDVINKMAGMFPGAPRIEWNPEAGGGDWKQPLPPELWGPLVAICEAIKAVNTDGRFDEYTFDYEGITDDTALREVVTNLTMALEDPDFMQIMKAGPGGAPEMEGEEATEGEGGEEDEDMNMYASRMR